MQAKVDIIGLEIELQGLGNHRVPRALLLGTRVGGGSTFNSVMLDRKDQCC